MNQFRSVQNAFDALINEHLSGEVAYVSCQKSGECELSRSTDALELHGTSGTQTLRPAPSR